MAALAGLIVFVIWSRFWVIIYRSKVEPHSVTINHPTDTSIQTVEFMLVSSMEVVEFVARDAWKDSRGFDPASGTTFQVLIHGYHTTKWGGLYEDKGRFDRVIVVRVQTADGRRLTGLAELAPKGQQTIVNMAD